MFVMITATYPLHKQPEVMEVWSKARESPSTRHYSISRNRCRQSVPGQVPGTPRAPSRSGGNAATNGRGTA